MPSLGLSLTRRRRGVRLVSQAEYEVPELEAPASSSTFDSNAGWSWFSSPEAICYSGNRRKMFVGWVQGVTPYDVVISQYDLDTGGHKKFVLSSNLERDDHDNPGIAVLADGRLLAMYCKHNDASGWRYRISTYPEDISEWGAESYVAPSGITPSYSNVFHMSDGRTFAFGRSSGPALPSVFYSDDEAVTWSTPVRFSDLSDGGTKRSYVRYCSNGTDEIHIFASTGHPASDGDGINHLYHCVLKKVSGTWGFYKSDGTLSKTLATVAGGSMLGSTDWTKVYDVSESPGAYRGGNAWTWSIALDGAGRPVVTYTTFPTADHHRYHYGRWTGSAWVKNVIVADAGPSLYGLAPQAEELYSHGVAVDPSDTRVVWLSIAAADATKSELWKYRTLDGGSTWESVRVTSGSETDKSYRPVVPRDKLAGAPDVLFNKGTYGTFSGWNVALKAGPSLTLVSLPVNSVAPAITGADEVGETASVSNGTWSNSPTGYTYQWRRGGTAISGATSSTYLLQGPDADEDITCTVTASNAGGPASATSDTITPTGPPVAPANSVAPAISGTTTTGETLTCSTGTWSGSPSYTYQWKNNGAAISGETNSTYVLVAGDVGDSVKCTVTATNVAGSTAADSNTVTPSAPSAPSNSVAPAVTGTPNTGQTVSCSTGTWTGSPTGYTYQWKRNGSSISGATANTYLLDVADEGTTVKCTVTATNAGGSTAADSNTISPTAAPSGPGGVATGLYAWWKADAGTSTTSDGTGISQWDDSSTNGRHLVQATGAKQPLYKASIINSKPVLRFQGTDDVLSITGITAPGCANPSDLSIFIVVKAVANGQIVGVRDGGNGWIYRQSGVGTPPTGLFGHIGATPNVTANADNVANFQLLEMVRTALSVRMGVNGTMNAPSSVSAYPPASTRLDVGAEANSGGNPPAAQFFTGDIAEIIVYSTAVSDSDRDSIETYLGTKYNITVA